MGVLWCLHAPILLDYHDQRMPPFNTRKSKYSWGIDWGSISQVPRFFSFTKESKIPLVLCRFLTFLSFFFFWLRKTKLNSFPVLWGSIRNDNNLCKWEKWVIKAYRLLTAFWEHIYDFHQGAESKDSPPGPLIMKIQPKGYCDNGRYTLDSLLRVMPSQPRSKNQVPNLWLQDSAQRRTARRKHQILLFSIKVLSTDTSCGKSPASRESYYFLETTENIL